MESGYQYGVDSEEFEMTSSIPEEVMIDDKIIRYVNMPLLGKKDKQTIFENPDGSFNIRKFSDFNVSTMTLVAYLGGYVNNIENVFYLLPITFFAENDLPRPPGTITSARWKGKVRGEHGGFFKNSVIIDIWTANKKVSTKLSSVKIQMCGAESVAMGEEASKYIVSHVLGAAHFHYNVQTYPNDFMEVSQWLTDNSHGEYVTTYRETECIDVGNGTLLSISNDAGDHYIKWPTVIPEQYQYFAEEIIKRYSDLIYVSEIMMRSDYIRTMDTVCTPDLAMIKCSRAMVNYNYTLGFEVNRNLLTKTLREMGYEANFINTMRPHTTVEMESDVTIDQNEIVRREGNTRRQVFLIYFSGTVMHTGPGGSSMEDCYYRLMLDLTCIKDIVSRKGQYK